MFSSYMLCLEISQELMRSTDATQFSKYDFGRVEDTVVVPMGVQANPDPLIPDVICATVHPLSATEVFFPIVRRVDWATQGKTYYGEQARAMLYTLAAIFLVVALYGAITLLLFGKAYLYDKASLRLQSVYMVLFIFAFNFGTLYN
jgi:hypothetical protein